MLENIEICLNIDADNSHLKSSQILSNQTQLSQAVIKDAMQKGAVWLIRGKSKQRLRRASKLLQVGDQLALNYNPELLSSTVPQPKLIHDAGDYSIWFKPYGLNCQGSRWGDFASIGRWVEINLPRLTNTTERPVFLVHRLDRATTGLILLSHSKTSARLFSDMFQAGQMDKGYQAIVQGDFSGFGLNHKLEWPVQDKKAVSIFSHVDHCDGVSLVDVKLLTGRKHQIRQHLSHLGYPILGDRLYGNQTSHTKDLQLQSVSLQFKCPFSQKLKHYRVEPKMQLSLDS
ncbi:RluA family pseudouridine synthase [Catenovulum maritimum]|uniref:Pseudouridine synthase RsuA/RluA-like domain-containing protein n=1 Tax=Catenovulum maritimum TaxID=1513271 RepID=A0A0J8JM49_9ALTE|nr:RNA pseudouridine synthase [Catenovulum maritimum]KMT65656.1 hypothetical protein XM47_08140 [Catenovulum maritimum]